MYINVYEIGREYGGPEEGGWWFDTGVPVVTVGLDSAEDGGPLYQAIIEDLERRFPNTHTVGNTSYRGGDYRIWCETVPAKEFPEQYPRYE